MVQPICPTAQLFSRDRWKQRVEGRYVVNENGCWDWRGPRDRKGYGVVRLRIGGRLRYTGAHRATWIALRGPIYGPDLEIDHLCRNRACVNPFHLEVVTGKVNTERAVATRKAEGAKFGRPRGSHLGCRVHGFDDGYLKAGKDSYTRFICRTCASRRRREHREKTPSSGR